jgi:nitrite reductase (NO-forming)
MVPTVSQASLLGRWRNPTRSPEKQVKRSVAVAIGLITSSCAQDTSGGAWLMEPDPSVVDFPLEDARSVDQELVAPPFLPEHEQVASEPPRVVNIRMEIVEREVEIAPGIFVWQMAFNNSVPGPVPVVFQWDWVNLTLVNGTTQSVQLNGGGAGGNTLVHNIDFHAATGAMGGGERTLVAPGQEVGLLWRAVKAGFFVYHCAPGAEMIPYHVMTGGNGGILVLPREGLRDANGNPVRYDRAFYFGEQDYYIPMNEDGTSARFDNFLLQMGPMIEVMRGLTPTHIAFNGKYGALTSDIRLEAEVGETVLMLHSEANNPSFPHLIGGHGDWVWPDGKFGSPPDQGLETWTVAAGGTAAAVYTFRQPGTYAYVNHNLIKAILFDAKALIHVAGEWDDDLMTNTFPARPLN